jgi:DNA-binding response OmpR family regulator
MSLRIQIIEDEVLIAETIRMHLEDQGHEVCNISISYEEAVEAFANDRPDLAIIDIRLYGEKSGIDYARYLFEQTNRIPFIFLTSQQDRRIFNLAVETLTVRLSRQAHSTRVTLDDRGDCVSTISASQG